LWPLRGRVWGSRIGSCFATSLDPPAPQGEESAVSPSVNLPRMQLAQFCLERPPMAYGGATHSVDRISILRFGSLIVTLNELKEALSKKPTMMGLSGEKGVIVELMKMGSNEILQEPQIFSEIMWDLLISRSTSFYAISDQDAAFFMAFSKWLKDMSDLVSGPRKEEMKDLARIYSLSP
jgi:hypothetical protein